MMQSNLQGRLVAWICAAILIVANVAGYAFDLYAMAWWFDRVLHAATIFALTLWLALIICAPAFRPGQPLLAAVLIAGLGVAIGAWWEVAEWFYDMLAPQNVIKGKDDTVIDIIMDTFGAGLAAALALRFMRPDGTTRPVSAG